MSLVKNRKGGIECAKCKEVICHGAWYESESGVCGNCLSEERRADDLNKERTVAAKTIGILLLLAIVLVLGGHG